MKSMIFKILMLSVVLSNGLTGVQAFAATDPAAEPARNISTAVRIELVVAHASNARESGYLQFVDARSYWHCHNIAGRTYCHKDEPLPRNWPPNSNTPGTSSLRKLRAHTRTSHAGHHRRDCWLCWR